MPKTLCITENQDGRRVDRLLRTMWQQVPLSVIMKSIRTGAVRIDGKKVKQDFRVSEGQLLQVPWDDEIPKTVTQTPINKNYEKLESVYKDENVWIVNKPAGLLTQPDVKFGDSVVSRVISELNWHRTDFSPTAVHRLDRNTSGLVIVALNGKVQRLLSELIRNRSVSKFYVAVVSGVTGKNGVIKKPLSKDKEKNIVSVNSNGAEAVTAYKTLFSAERYSVVEIELITGRSHQIRVHFASEGHYVLGDRKYGKERDSAKRTLLHAYKIVLPNDERLPDGLKGKSFVADIPTDMKKYLK